MITKVKRVRLNKKPRQKFAVGDEARKFENIPTASQPQQQELGTRQEFADKYVTSQIAKPELAPSATQAYTSQAVQADELLGGTTMAAPTDVGQQTVTGSTISTPTTGVSTAVAAPGALTATQMTSAELNTLDKESPESKALVLILAEQKRLNRQISAMVFDGLKTVPEKA